MRATAIGAADDPAWTESDALLVVVRLADELHRARLPPTMDRPIGSLGPPQLVELPIIAGAYHVIAYVAHGAQVEREEWAARFPESGASV